MATENLKVWLTEKCIVEFFSLTPLQPLSVYVMDIQHVLTWINIASKYKRHPIRIIETIVLKMPKFQ